MYKNLGRGAILIAALGLSILLGMSPIAHAAAPDPTVVVVRDVTPARCTLQYSTLVGPSFVPEWTVPCPAGTVMEDVQVSLSEAKAKHETYVVLPARTSSSAEQTQTRLQIQQLEDRANVQLHLANQSVTTASSCTVNSHGYYATWYLPWDSKTTFQSWVYWDTHSDCTIYIRESMLNAMHINSYFYWGHDQYAAWSGNVGCVPVTQSYPQWFPDITKNPGYTYEEHVYSGSNCTIFDKHAWTDLGPLS